MTMSLPEKFKIVYFGEEENILFKNGTLKFLAMLIQGKIPLHYGEVLDEGWEDDGKKPTVLVSNDRRTVEYAGKSYSSSIFLPSVSEAEIHDQLLKTLASIKRSYKKWLREIEGPRTGVIQRLPEKKPSGFIRFWRTRDEFKRFDEGSFVQSLDNLPSAPPDDEYMCMGESMRFDVDQHVDVDVSGFTIYKGKTRIEDLPANEAIAYAREYLKPLLAYLKYQSDYSSFPHGWYIFSDAVEKNCQKLWQLFS